MPKFIESVVIESGDLFQAAERLDASLNLDLAVRKAITVAVKQSSKSRAQVADDLARLTGHRVSEHMLHSFSSESKEGHRFPAAWLAAFCVSTRDRGLLQTIVEHAGYRLVTNDEAMLIELARAYLAHKEAAEKIVAMENRVSVGTLFT